MTIRRSIRTLPLAAILSCAALAVAQTQPPFTPTTAADAGPLKIAGQTEPVAKVEVPAGSKGQLAMVAVKEGQFVKKGDVLAKLDDALQQATVDLARMQAESTTEIRDSQNQLEFAKLENEQWQHNASATELEKKNKELAVKRAELVVELSQDKQRQAQIALKREQITLDRMTIRSPLEGAVLRINKQVGEETDDNPLVVIVQVSKLNAVFFPRKELFGKVKVGDKFTLDFATAPAVQREATVVAVDPIIEQALFRVKFEVDNGDAKIPAGTPATWTWTGK